MRLPKPIIGFLLVLSVLWQHGCKKKDAQSSDNSNPGNEKPGHIPGIGDEPGVPAGTLFKLPKEVSLVGELRGKAHNDPSSTACVHDGQGDEVIVTMTLQRDSVGGPLTVEFPAGLIIVSTSEGFQSGLLVERVLVTLPPKPPGAGSPQCDVTLLAACLNVNKNASEDHVKYKWGPVTESPLLKDFIKRVSNKKISYSAYAASEKNSWHKVSLDLQDALWNITDHDGLDRFDLANIEKMPNK